MDKAIICPQCNAPLVPRPFSRTVKCEYCGVTVRLDESVISASLFHEAYRRWNSPNNHQISSWVSIGEKHWTMDEYVRKATITDIFYGRRARWPTELVTIKLLRDKRDKDLFENEWESLQFLHRSEAHGADIFASLLPQPVLLGVLTDGQYAGRSVSIFRRECGFRYTLGETIKTYPEGIPPRASIWIWRRILEMLSFIHTSGMLHGAVLPSHLLIQKNEHGVRLVEYAYASRIGQKRLNFPDEFEVIHPKLRKSSNSSTVFSDLSMSARCVILALGGDPVIPNLPASVPQLLSELILKVADSDNTYPDLENAWAIREQLGQIAEEIYGPPLFIPLKMPS